MCTTKPFSVFSVLVVTLLLSTWAEVHAAPPPNDACGNATTIGQVTDLPFTSIDATPDFPCWGCGVGWTFGPDIWYNYTAPSFGTVTVSTCHTDYWHVIAIYDGHGCPAGTLVTCSDGGPPSLCWPQNQVQFLANAGQQFKIRIGGRRLFCDPTRDETGTGELTLSFAPSNCGNSNAGSCCQSGGNGTPYCNNGLCCAAVCDIMPLCCDVEWDEACATLANSICNVCICAAQPPQAICECAGTISDGVLAMNIFDNIPTDGPPVPQCGGQIQYDKWWNYTANCTGILTIQSIEWGSVGHAVAIYNGWDCPPLDENVLGCSVSTLSPISITAPVTQGQQIKFRVGSWGGDTGSDISISITCVPYVCGLAGTGACCDTSGTDTPYCDDGSCCSAVCNIDPYCCAVEWDYACAALAHIHCNTCETKPSSDCDFDGIPDDWVTAGSVPLGKLVQRDAAQHQGMGWSAALGAYALFGSRGDDDGSGAVFSFDMVSNHAASAPPFKFKADDADAGAQFGYSIAVSANLAAIGAPYDDEAAEDAGAVYVFRDLFFSNAWEQYAKLMADDATGGDAFGDAVAIAGNLVLVGATLADSAQQNTGAVYAFLEQTPGEGDYIQTSKFVSDDIAAADAFGISIAMAGITAVIGAPGNDDDGDFSGSAYIFREVEPGTWQQLAKLTASDGAKFDRFGTSVAMNTEATTVVIGAPSADPHETNSGAAYVFRESPTDSNNWVQIAKLTPDDAAEDDRFGHSVSITDDVTQGQGDTVLIGAYGKEAAYVFREVPPFDDVNNFVQIDKLTAGDGQAGDQFGWAVAILGNRAIVGAFWNDHAGFTNAGAGYAYVVRIRDCNGNGVPDHCEISSTAARDCNSNSVPDSCEGFDTIENFVAALLADKPEYFWICVFDQDENEVLDGNDIAPYVDGLLGP